MKVHIADNHDIMIAGLKAVLNRNDIQVTGSSKNGLEVIKWRENNDADILILDISMPIMNGIDVLKHFKSKNINQKTIILSSYNDFYFINDAMKIGAKGYILKSEGDKLIEALNVVHKGGKYLSENSTKKILNRNLETSDITEKAETKILLQDLISENKKKLSDQEESIIRLMAKNYSSKEIQELLSIKSSTLRTYTSRIRDKLNIKTTEDLIKYSIAIS